MDEERFWNWEGAAGFFFRERGYPYTQNGGKSSMKRKEASPHSQMGKVIRNPVFDSQKIVYLTQGEKIRRKKGW